LCRLSFSGGTVKKYASFIFLPACPIGRYREVGVPRFEIILSKKLICGAALSVPIFLPEEAGKKDFHYNRSRLEQMTTKN